MTMTWFWRFRGGLRSWFLTFRGVLTLGLGFGDSEEVLGLGDSEGVLGLGF